MLLLTVMICISANASTNSITNFSGNDPCVRCWLCVAAADAAGAYEGGEIGGALGGPWQGRRMNVR